MQQLSSQYRIDRGEAARQFVNSRFYLEFLKPYLEQAGKSIAIENLNIPLRVKDPGQIAVYSALNSGKVEMIQSLFSDLEGWQQDGDLALKALEKSKEEK